MALQKTPVSVNFAKGLETKSDPYQVQLGNFLALQNSVFTTTNRLTKRNGFANITTLPNTEQTTITTLNDNLLATGSNLYAFSQDTNQWLDQGVVQPVQLSTLPIVRSSTSQFSPDMALTSNGLACTVYIDSGQTYYQVSDSTTGQLIVQRTQLPTGSVNPRVFLLNRYFVVTFEITILATPHLQFIAIPIASPNSPLPATDISTSLSALQAAYDGYVANNVLYVAWSGPAATVKIASVSATLIVSTTKTLTSQTADIMSVTADTTGSTPTIWLAFYDSGTLAINVAAYDHALNTLISPATINSVAINNLVSIATDGLMTVFYENDNNYSFTPNLQTDFITRQSITVAGVISPAVVILRSVNIASKPFMKDDTGVIYLMCNYVSEAQPTYFLIDLDGNIFMRLAYANSGGNAQSQVLPSVSMLDSVFYYPYLVKTNITSVNKNTDLPTGTPTNPIYASLGINLAKFSINTSGQYSSEIANTLHLTGGQLWQYDGVKPVEQGFHIYPDGNNGSTVTGAGNLTAQTYYYVFTYEWTDNQGNIHRSAPSVPFQIDTTTASSTNTLYVPTLRLTYKTTPNPVRIVGYRWSVAQQVYYQFTSISNPTMNDPSIDSVTFTDTLADSSILGNPILYTTGGVLEHIAPPASIHTALFKNRLFLISAEDPNLLWYSNQVISNVPVEMSDLLTIYVAPTSGAQGSTGAMTALSAMDDKLIIFKRDAIYYITGNGPDVTGANNDFGDPIFVISSVGTSNPNSIVLTPNGVMFQSDKGIWLLGRDLGTSYIGAPVEAFNNQTVQSAEVIPGTNQVRFILNNGITLMYDYFFNQWGTFTNVTAISGTLYQGLHTYLNASGQVYQETPGVYLDGSNPVLMSFTTSWINVAGLQGFERFYFLYLLGTYYTPFKLNVQLAYNYNSSAQQATIITPDNYAPNWGDEAVWGSGAEWGGSEGNVFSCLLFPQIQKCSSFQITINEVFDPSVGVIAGQGLSLSGMNMVIGVKKGYRTQRASRSFG